MSLTLSNPQTAGNPQVGATLGATPTAILTILDNDSVLGFSPQSYSVSENSGAATITVGRAGGTLGVVTVNFTTVDGTALAGRDYTATNGTLVFTNGQTSATFTVPITDNLTVEGNRTNLLQLSNPVGTAVIGGASATLGIVDNEFGPGTLGFVSAAFSASETNGIAVITVSRTNGTVGAVSVDYATATGGTALVGTHYQTVSGRFTWPDSDITDRTFAVPVMDDLATNANRTVNLTLRNVGGGAAMSISNAVLTILDNDSVIGFSSTNYSVSENAGLALITVSRGGPAVDTVSVNFSVAAGTALGGTDFVTTNGTLSFAPGVGSQVFAVLVTDDTLVEGDETILLSLNTPVSVPVGSATLAITNAQLVIVDDEATISFTAASYVVGENVGRASITVQRLGVTNSTIQVDFATSNLTAIAGLHYTTTNGTLTFNPGTTNQTFDVRITDDLFVNASKDISVSLFNLVGPGGTRPVTPTNALITITDNDTNSPFAGSLDVTFGANLGANGPVYAVAFRDNGQLMLGGDFTTVNGGLVNRVARLNEDGTLDQNFNPGLGADTNILALAVQPDGAVLIGGQFSSVNGVGRVRLARLSANGSVDLTFNPGSGADADVLAVAVESSGAVLVGGMFTTFNGVPFSRLVRLAADGSLDGTFSIGAGANGPVRSIAAMADGRIVIAGDFTSFNGVAVPRIARLNSNGALDATFNAGSGADNSIFSVVTQTNGSVVVGGIFTTFGGLTRNGITRLNPDGTLDASFNSGLGANGSVLSVGLRRNGKVMLAGTFTAINGVSRNRFARLNADGTLDAAFDPGTGANNTVHAVSVFQPPLPVPQNIPITNLFFVLGGSTNAFDTGTTSGVVDVTFNLGTVGDTVRLYYQGVRLLDTNFVGSQTFSVPFGPGTSTVVTIMVNEGNVGSFFQWDYSGTYTPTVTTAERVVIGGNFSSVNGVARERLAQLNENGSMDTTFGLGSGNSIVLGIGLNTNLSAPDLLGKSVVGGNFTALNGANVSRLARLNLDGSLDLGFNIGAGANDTINAVLVQPDGRVIIGGFFTNFSGVLRGRIARVNANGSLDLGFETSLGANNVVLTLAQQPDGKVIVGGLFTTINGTARNFVARLNVDGTVDSSFNTSVGADGAVRSIAVQSDGKVLVGGDFSTFNGVGRNRLARLNPDGSLDTAFNPGTGFNGFVSALALDASGRIVAGGSFITVNGVARNRIVRLTSSGGVDLTFDPGLGFDDYINAVTVLSDGKLLLVGGFTSYNGVQANRLARLNPDGSVDTSINFGTGANNFVAASVVQPWDAKVLVGGAFSSVDGQTRNGVARLNAGANGGGSGSFEFTVLNYLADENATNATVTVVRRAGLTGSATVQIATSDGTALQGSDYVGATNTLTFGNGQNVTNFVVRILDNTNANPNKTVVLTLLNPSPGATLGTVNPATITIVDNDSLLEFSASTYSVNESSPAATITVVRNGGGAGAVSVLYATTGGSATAGLDFTSVSNQLDWAAGDVAPKTFDVPIRTDALAEGNETVVLTLFNPGGAASLGRSTAVLTIVDDDFSSGVLGFATNAFVVREDGGTAVITVVRTNGSTGPVSVQFGTANGSATAGLDYDATTGFLNFSDGQTNKTFTVTLINDVLPEGDESVVLTLSNPGNGAALGLSSAVLIIRDDEISNGVIGFSSSSYSVLEGAGSVAISVVRTTGSQGTVTANFTTADGTAKAGSDYTTTSGTLVFLDAMTNITFNIPILNDPLVESNEVVNLTLSTPTGGASLGQATAVVNIIDDDLNPGSFTLTGDYLVKDTESTRLHRGFGHHNIAGVLVTVTRVGGQDGIATVDFSTATNINTTAISGTDFIPTNGTLTFLDQEVAKSFVVTIIDNGPVNTNRFTNFFTFGRTFEVSLSNATAGTTLGATPSATVTIVTGSSLSGRGISVTGPYLSRHNYRVREDIGTAIIAVRNNSPTTTMSFRQPAINELWFHMAGSDHATLGADFVAATISVPGDGLTPVPILDDLVAEFNEDFIVQVREPGSLEDEGVVTILDNDDPPGAFDREYNPDFDDRTSPPQNSSPGANNTVFAVAVQADGRSVIGGDFSAVNTIQRSRIARMNLDGSLDTSFNPGVGANDFVSAIGVYPLVTNTVFTFDTNGVPITTNLVANTNNGKIVIGGGFTAFNGVARNFIARLDSAGGLDSGFNPGIGANAAIRALFVYQSGAFAGRVLVAGDFTSFNGTNRNHVARLNPNGSLDTSFDPGAGANGPIYAVRVQKDGKVVVGGNFTTFNGVPRNRIARLSATGALDASFNPSAGADGTVYALGLETALPTLTGGTAVSTNVNRSASGGFAEDIFDLQVPTPPNSPAGVLYQGTLTINYSFYSVPDIINVYLGTNQLPANRIYTTTLTNGSASVNVNFGPSTNDVLRIIVNEGSGILGTVWDYDLSLVAVVSSTPQEVPAGVEKVILGGEFNNFDLRGRSKIARLNANGSLDTSFSPGSGFNDTVFAIEMTGNGQTIAGGLFTDFNNTRRVGLARLLLNGTLDTTFMDASFSHFIGLINLTNGQPKNFVAALALQPATNTITSGTGTNATQVTSITEDVMIGGSFQMGGGGMRDVSNIVSPGFYGTNFTERIMAGFDRTDKIAQPGVFPRADIRKRSNIARVRGGSVRGPGNIEFTYPNYTIDEGAGSLFITLTRTNGNVNGEPPIGPAAVNFTTTDQPFGPGAGVAGQDYVTARLSPSWPGANIRPSDGATGANNLLRGTTDVFVSVTEDSTVEGDESVDLVLSLPQGQLLLAGERVASGVALGVARSTLVVVDNDFSPGVLTFALPTYVVDENVRNAVVTVIRTNGSAGPISCDYATTITGSSATVGVDYTATSGTIAFGAGQLTNTFVVPITDDTGVELDETIQLVLLNPRGGASLGRTNAVIQIVDNDFAAGRLNFSQPTYSVAENAGVATITVLRSGGSLGALTVQVAVTNGTAVSPGDFAQATNTLVWAAGETASKTFAVALVDNLNVDSNRTVNLTLFNPSIAGALGTTTNAILTIVDDDAYGDLAFSRSLYSANENGSQAIITVVRLGGVAGTVSARYDTVTGGTALAGSNYVAASGTLLMVPGQTSTNFVVTILDNNLADGARTVALALSNPINAGIGFPSVATLTIIDDESQNVTAGSSDTTYTSTGGDNAIYALALQLDGNLLVGGDFTAVNGVSRNRLARLDANGALDPVFNPGGANGSIRNILVYNSGPNTGRILVSGFFTQVSGTNRARIARLNQGGAVDLTFDPGAGADNAIYAMALQTDDKVVIGGGFSTFNGIGRNFIARLNANGTLDNTFDPGTGANGPIFAVAVQADGKVLIGGDFTTVNGTALTNLARLHANGSVDTSFITGSGANSTVRSLIVQTDGKILMAGSFTNYAGSTIGRVARLHASGLLDSSFNTGGVGADNAVFYMSVQGDGKMLLGGDFTRYNGVSRNRFARLNPEGTVDPTINIGTGANNFIAAIAVQTDDRILVAGGFTTFNGVPRNYLARMNGGVISGSGNLEFTAANFSASENSGEGLIGVRRVGGTTGAASVLLTTSDGTATTNGIHYTNVTATLNFPEGETFVSTSVPLVDDSVVNPDRYVNLTLSAFAGAASGGQTNALLTIVNDDGRLGFSAATYNVSEVVGSGSATVTVIRTGGTTGQSAVQFTSTTNGTATPNVDFVPVSGTLVFATGETNKTFSVPIIDDLLLEGNETIELVLTNLTGGAVPGQLTAILTIVDNDVAPGVLNFALDNYVTNESDGIILAQITVTRTNGSTGVVSVDYRTGDGTARSGQDYVPAVGTLSFADGELLKTFVVPILPDSVQETNETVFLELVNATGGATIGFQNSAVLTIFNNDILIYGNLVFSSATYTNRENDGAAVIAVRRIGGTTGNISVDYATTTNGTATPGFHYSPVSGTLSWAAGDNGNRLIVVPIYNNTLVDGDHTVTLALSNPTNGASLNIPSTAVLNLLDDDSAPGVLGFSVPLFNVQESASNVVLTVVRTNGFTGPVSVQFATFTNANDSAVAYSGSGAVLPGVHSYTNTAGRLDFTNGVTNLAILVPLIDNGLQDGNRTFSVRLFGETGGALLGLSNAVVRIVDNENNAGTFDTGFITGTGADGAVHSIRIATNGQSLIAGDFGMFNGVVRQGVARINTDGTLDNGFDPGAITVGTNSLGTIRALGVYTNGFNVNKVVIGGVFSFVANAGRTNIARLNADGTPDSTFDPGPGANNAVNSVAIQNNGRVLLGGTFTAVQGVNRSFVARLNFDGTLDTTFDAGSGPSAQVRVITALSDGKILIAGDFDTVAGVPSRRIARLNVDGTVDTTFTAGGLITNGAVFSLAIQVNGQILVGGQFTTTNAVPRTNLIRLNADGSLDPSFNIGLGANDFVSAVALQNDGKILVSGAFTTFNGFGRNRIVRLDSTGAVDPSINFGTGADNLAAALAVQPDGKILVGGNFTSFNGVPQNRFTRLHGGQNAGSGLLVFAAPVFSVSEAGTNALITVLRTGGTSNTVTVDYSVISGGTAQAGVDYLSVGGTLIYGEGETLRTFVVPVIDDTAVRPDRTVFLTLSNATGGASLDIPPTALLQIAENDSLIAFSAPSYGIAESGGSALVTVTRSGGTNELVTVDYFTAALTATPGLDFTNVAGSLTFLPGVINQTFTVPVVEDLLVEGSETVGLFLTNAGPIGIAVMGGFTNATLTIVDNDFGVGVLGFASTNFSVFENVGLATVVVSRTNGSSGAVSVSFATLDGQGNATAGVDYLSTNGVLTLADGESSKAFAVRVLDDASVEGNETLAMVLFGTSGGAGLGLTNATLTIVDDDAFGTFQFSTNSYSVVEAAGSVAVTVQRIGGIIGAVSVGVLTEGGSAVALVDYTPVVQLLTFTAGQTSSVVNVTILDDQIAEPLKTVNILLTNAQGGALLGAQTNAIISILDDDMQFSFVTSAFTVLENATNAVVNVIRYGVSNVTGSVIYSTTDGTASNATDYVGITNTLVFLPGVTNTNFTVAIIDNQVGQLDRTLNLSLASASPTNIASVGTNGTATLTIVDNDNSFNFSATGYNVLESAGTVVITVLRTGQNTRNVTVDVSTTPLVVANAATAGLDYLAKSETLTFAPGVNAVGFVVTNLNDLLPEGNELFGVTLSNARPIGEASLGATNTALVSITDDDIGIGFSAAAYTVSESSGAATITVLRAGVTNVAVSASFTTTNGTALAGVDYVATNAVLTFASGVNTQTFTVPLINDALAESPETVNLVLFNPTGGALLTTSNAVLTIVDNVGSLGFTSTNFLVGESSTNGIVLVARTGGSSGAITVQYLATAGGTATDGLDFAGVAGTLSWTNGETGSKSFTVAVFNDQVVEPTETIALRLTNATGGASLSISNATLSIVDNDGAGGVDFVFDPGVGFNSTVFALAQQTNGQVLVAGAFTDFNGTARSRVARLNIDGSLDAGYNLGLGPDNTVNAVALQTDGRLVIAGDFTSVGGVLRGRVARLLADGSLDTTFSSGTGANNSIFAAALQADGKVVVGGSFTNFNGNVRTRIARLNTSGSLDTSFNPTNVNGTVNAIAIYRSGTNSGKLLVGGSFTAFNGVTVGRIIRLNPDGSRDATFAPLSGANSTIAALSIQPDGKIVIGGLFTSVNGTARSRLARLNDDGSLDGTFLPVMNDSVLAVAAQADGRVVVGGAFTTVNGDTGVPPAPGAGVTTRERTANVVTLTTSGAHNLVPGSRVVIAGAGVGFDGTFTVTATPSTTQLRYSSAGVDVVPTAVTPAGTFSAAGTTAGRIARFLTDGSNDPEFATGTGANNLIFAVLVQSDLRVLLAGDFTTLNSAVRGRIARLNGNSNSPITTTLGSAGFSAGQFQISLAAEPGRRYRIDVSTDLRTWQSLGTVDSGHGVINFTDSASVGSARRYYRAERIQ